MRFRHLFASLTAAVLAAVAATPLSAPVQAQAAVLDNGLARTPQMGFNNWNSTGCRAEFNEAMIKGIADIFVQEGLKDAGYEYVNVDDCWALPQRGADGNLVPDPVRFPNGIKAVADYVHSKGLKFGIYSSAGTKTCDTIGFPGGLGHEQQDANLWASWGVDYLKYDNCNNQGVDAVQRYTTMRDALKKTGRNILFSLCEWGENKPWLWARDVGNSWRTTGDISDGYSSMVSIVHQNMALAPYAGPGHWNDPDMLEVGNGGMTDTEYRSHFSLWSVMAAPLMIGTDLRKATPETMKILLNKEVIAVDQDTLGIQGTAIATAGGRNVFVKPLADGSRAVALFNESDSPQRISTTAEASGLPSAKAYKLRDLWAHQDRETAGTISALVPPHGTVFYRVSVDTRWSEYPPAVDFGLSPATTAASGPVIVDPGKTTRFRTDALNQGRLPAASLVATVQAPEGWTVQSTSAPDLAVLRNGQSFATSWTVTVPAGTAPGPYDLTAKLTHRGGARNKKATSDFVLRVVVPTIPPAGTGQLSALPWLTSTNGWGPVEKDSSNGEYNAGDGNPITINGVTYAKGLGVHAPSEIRYYTGARCSTVTADVGVDDEQGANGSVTFEIWADGTKVADSGLLTTADPAKHLSADVSGATTVLLVVTDGGNGITSDHADWADPKLTCA